MARILILIMALLVAPLPARASFIDVFDVGPSMGRAGAVAATVDGGAAAFYNPAGLGFRERLQLRVGAESVYSQLRLRRQRVPIDRPTGLLVEAATPVPLRGWFADRLALGIAMHIIPDTALWVDGPTRSEPWLPYYQNRTQRAALVPALAFRPMPNVAFGVGMNYFAGLDGTVRVYDGAQRDLQADLEEEFFGKASLHLGFRVDFGSYHLGLAYRAPYQVPFGTGSASVVADTPLLVDIEGDAMFTPETIVFAFAVDRSDWGVGADLSWRKWSDYAPPFARVIADAPLPLGGGERIEVQSRFDKQLTRDVVRLALSGHYDLAAALRLTGGYAYEPTPFLDQQGETNLLDNDKHILGMGGRWRGPRFGRVDWAVELAGQAHWMPTRRYTKDARLLPDEDPDVPGGQTSNGGYPTVAGGGFAFVGMFSLVVEIAPSEPAREVPTTSSEPAGVFACR